MLCIGKAYFIFNTLLDYPYYKQCVEYEVRFADTEQNRLHMLRFMFADHFDESYRRELLLLLEPYQEANEIVIRSHHNQYQIVPIVRQNCPDRVTDKSIKI